MSETATARPSTEGALQGKWIGGIAPHQLTRKVACHMLRTRLAAVWHWLPLAAQAHEADVERVHQLRVATRRAAAALRIFADLVPREIDRRMRDDLRRIRQAADEARNVDVFSQQFRHAADAMPGGPAARIVAATEARRRQSRQPIVTLYGELTQQRFEERIERLVARVESSGKGRRKFGGHARRALRAPLRKFVKASKADLSDDASLHQLRIRIKKLRYAMEVVAGAFGPAFRKKLYPRIGQLQDILGAMNDRAVGNGLFREWAAATPDAEERAILTGMLLADAKAHRDIRQAFLTLWTPEALADLRRRFKTHCRCS